MDPDKNSQPTGLNATSDGGSFSSIDSLSSMEDEIQRRRQKKSRARRQRLLFTLPVVALAVVLVGGIGFATNRFLASRFVRQPAGFFAVQPAPEGSESSSNAVSLPTSTTSQLAVNGDVAIAGNLSLSPQAITNLAATLTNKITLQSTYPGSPQAGNANITGVLGAGSFVGNGARLTNLNADALTTGTVNEARLPANVTRLGQSISLSSLQGNVISSLNGLVNNGGNLDLVAGANVAISASGTSITISSTGGSGSGISTINVGAGLTGGGTGSSVNIDIDGAIVTTQGNSFNAAGQLVQLNGSGALPAVDGSLLTNLSGSAIATGTVSDARLSANVTLQGNTFNSASQLVQLTGLGYLPVLNASNLTDLNASSLATGTVPDARLSTNITQQGNIFNGAAQLVQLTGLGYLPVLNASNLTNLNASALATGTVPDARLSTNVPLKDGQNVFANQGIAANEDDFVVQDATGATGVFNVASNIGSVFVGYPSDNAIPSLTNYRLDVNGDLNVEPGSSTLMIGGSAICGTLICAIQEGNGNYIQNWGTLGFNLQTGNLAIQSGGFSTVAARIQALSGQSANLFQLIRGNAANALTVAADGTANAYGQVAVVAPSSSQAITAGGAIYSTLRVDALTNRVGVGYGVAVTPNYTLDVNGDANMAAAGSLRINGVALCTLSGCASDGTSSEYIQNTTLPQTANYAIQSASAGSITGRMIGAVGQNTDIFQVVNSSGVALLNVGKTGDTELRVAANSDSVLRVVGTDTVLRVDTSLEPSVTLANGNYASGTAALNVRVQASSSDDAVSVITAGGGNLVQAESTLGTVLQVASTGQALFATTTNSTTGFRISNSAGSAIPLSVDTLNGQVNVGGGALTAKLGVTTSGSELGWLLNNTGTGKTILIQNNGTDVFSVADTGAVLVQPSVNTTIALELKSSGGSSILAVGTGADSTNRTPSFTFNGAAIGEVGSWTTNGTNMNKSMRDASYAYVNGFVYRFGGTQQASKTVFTVEGEIARATVNSDGSIGSWTVLGNILDGSGFYTRAYIGLAYVNGGFISAGGFRFNGTGANTNGTNNMHNGSEYVKLKSDGTLGPYTNNISFNAAAPGGSQTTEAAMASDDNANLYYIGGVSDTINAAPLTTIWQYSAKANLLPGFLGGGSWPYNQVSPGATPALPAGRAGHAAVTANGYLYVIGGYSGAGGTSVQSTVYYSKMNGTGGAGSWSTTTALPAARKYHCAGVTNGFLYVWGGNDGSNALSSVIYAKINSDGTLGSWITSTQTMPTSISNAGCFIANGRLYSLGGITGAGSTTNAVYYAEIAKVRVNGDLDLVGIGSPGYKPAQNETGSVSLNGSSYGGELTAGSVYAKGNLQVGGQAQFAGGLSVLNGFTVEGDALIKNAFNNNMIDRIGVDDTTGGTTSRFFNIDTLADKVSVNPGYTSGNLNAANAKLDVKGGTVGQNLLQVTDTSGSAVNVMTIADGGATTFKNVSDTSQAFNVQNAAGTSLFTVDTASAVITLGSSSADFSVRWPLLSTPTRTAVLRDFVCSASEAVYDIVEFNGADTVARTTTANSNRVAGIVTEKPNATTCTTAIAGLAQVNFGANAAPQAFGDPIVTSTTAGMAASTQTPPDGALIGNSASSKNGSNLVLVRIRRD